MEWNKSSLVASDCEGITQECDVGNILGLAASDHENAIMESIAWNHIGTSFKPLILVGKACRCKGVGMQSLATSSQCIEPCWRSLLL